MGIPYYFYHLVHKKRSIITYTQPKCSRFFLDFNSIIHLCSAQVVAQHPTDYTNLAIFKEIANFTLELAKNVAPTDLLYIGVDGVAPRAKIQQQRKRRYMTAHRNDIIDGFKTTHKLPVTEWDSNCITPGTPFMHDLQAFLTDFFNAQAAAATLPYKVILSGHDEKGEGEHKIIHYIKTNPQNTAADIIYGLDADLIMLCLGIPEATLYLLRETKYLDIQTLRTSISNHLYNKEDIALMYDYIFMCFFLGNDFVPSLPFLKIKSGAVDLLCDVYKKTYEELQNQNLIVRHPDTNLFTVNHMFLSKVVEKLSELETKYMQEAIEQHESLIFYPSSEKNKLTQFVHELEHYPILHRSSLTLCPMSDPQWRLKYYHHLFGSSSSSTIKQCSLKYIEGLCWITNYYFNHQYDTTWYYPYDYSPSALDINKYMCTMNTESLQTLQITLSQTPEHQELSCVHQMLMVLPPHSQQFVPQRYRCLYDDISLGCVQWFPSKFNVETFMKTQLWECSPILPLVPSNETFMKLTKIV